ncbi:MAG: hypothetical protein FWF88_06810 [Peptococcaceae bacterium]|nr:hypothetical protein [Peptococcaceae bacterium]
MKYLVEPKSAADLVFKANACRTKTVVVHKHGHGHGKNNGCPSSCKR